MKNLEKELLDLTIQLIKIPSVSSDISKLNEIVDFVEDYFKGSGLKIERFKFNDKPSIVFSNFDGKWADITLNGHLDVVPSSEENQFQPYIENGYLYGRGAGDMKSGVAIIMKLMKDLGSKSKKKINLILTTDEEVGGFDGAAKLVKLGYGGDVVIIPDGGSIDKIVYAEKGIFNFSAKFFGKNAHSSRPWLGENAIDNAIKFYRELKNLLEDKEKLDSEDHWSSTVNMTMINGGKGINVIPDELKVRIDIRFIEEWNLEKLKSKIEELLKKFGGKLDLYVYGDCLWNDKESIYIKKFEKIFYKVFGRNVIFLKEHGASDGRFFKEDNNIVILYKPLAQNEHSKKERVEVNSLYKCYLVFKEYINFMS